MKTETERVDWKLLRMDEKVLLLSVTHGVMDFDIAGQRLQGSAKQCGTYE
jgi:hypothetical protein